MITFSHPGFLHAGIGVVALVAIAFANRARRSRRLAAFLGGTRAARRLSARDLFRLKLERIALLASAALCIAAAAAGPRRVQPVGATGESAAPERPTAIMVAIDVSTSMQGTDVSPTRLGAAVRIARELVEAFDGSEVGVMLVAGKGYALSPPTYDHRGLFYLLDGVTPTTTTPWDPGSRLSAGIREGMAQLAEPGEDGRDRVLVLISDGEVAESPGDAVAAARAASATGVEVHTVGVGPDRGASGLAPGVGEPLLRRLAEAGGGTYRDGTDASGAVNRPGGRVSALEPGDPASAGGGGDLAFSLIAGALVLVLVDGLLDGPFRFKRRGVRWKAS